MKKTFEIPKNKLTNKSLKLRVANNEERIFEYSFDDYFISIMSDKWWFGENTSENRGTSSVNNNDSKARTAASLRIQEAYEFAQDNGDLFILEEADLDWLIDRARSYKLPQEISVLTPKLAKYFSVLLNATPVT